MEEIRAVGIFLLINSTAALVFDKQGGVMFNSVMDFVLCTL